MVSNSPTVWLTAAITFVAVVLGMLALAMLVEWFRERRLRKGALNQLAHLTAEPSIATAGAASILKEMDSAQPRWMQLVVGRMRHLADLSTRLEQADLTWSPQSYLMRSAGFAIGLGLAALLVTGMALVAVPAATLGALLPHFWVGRRIKKRLRAFEEHLPDSIDLMSRAIRAGHPLSSGFKMVSEEGAEPVASEIGRVFEEQRFGMAFDDSLLAMTDRVPLVDSRILVTAILIQREVGGNLAEILDKLARIIRERFQIRRQLRTYTAQARLSGLVLAVLPIAVGVAFYFLNPDYILTLFREPVGHLLLGGAFVLQVAGYLWIRKITNIEI